MEDVSASAFLSSFEAGESPLMMRKHRATKRILQNIRVNDPTLVELGHTLTLGTFDCIGIFTFLECSRNTAVQVIVGCHHGDVRFESRRPKNLFDMGCVPKLSTNHKN